jgi:hypothetical protein
MAQQNIDFGTFPDDPDADAIRTAFSKVQNNFTELFSTVTAGSVASINGGAGIAVNTPTGNVIVTANLAQVVVSTSSLSIGQGSNGGTSATITTSAQTLVIDINPANVFSGNFSGVSGALANFTGRFTANSNSQPNITSVGTLSNLSVTGNITAGNVYANSGTIGAANLTGSLTTAAQGNITSVGTLTGLGVNGTVTAVAFTANTGVFTGDGGGLSNLSVSAGSTIVSGSSNVKVELNSNVNVTVAGVANIVTVTSTGSNVNGYLTVTGNVTSGNANLGNTATANYFIGSGNNLSNIQGANVSGAVSYATTANAVAGANVSGAVAYATTANAVAGANVSGAVSYATTANAVAGANVSGAVAYATTANAVAGANVSGQVSNALVAGTVYTNAQPNITSVGTLSSLTVTGNITSGNVYANSGIIKAQYLQGDGSNLTNLSAGIILVNGNSNVSIPTTNGNVSISAVGNANILVVTGTGVNVVGTINATGTITGNFSGNVITSSQGNITSLGTLTGLTVSGTANLGAVGNVKITGGNSGQLLQSDGNGNLLFSSVITQTIPGVANVVLLSSGSNTIIASGNIKFNDPQLDITGTLAVTGNANVGNLSATSLTGTLTTASNQQPYITRLGTLDYLIINTTGYLSMGSGNITAGNISLIAAGSANLGNSATANYFIGNFYGTANTATTAGTVTTAAQGNITSVGTLTGLGVNGTITGVNITANSGVFTGNGSALTALNASNVSSGTLAQARLANASVTLGSTALTLGSTVTTVAGLTSVTSTTFVGALTGAATSATTAGTVTTAAQPNITSVGTLTSLNSSGNITAPSIIANTGYFVRSFNASVSAAGSTQGTGTALTTEFNRVSTVTSGSGVVLPTATAGMAIVIVNSSANSLLVYPASGAAINSLSTNTGYSHVTLATLQYIAISSTQWYTVGASYA